ncbi:PREDICTED: uncharacterized protein LOC101303799 [Fragaria vesca subsp. vesca]|uniref:uncharacterized protein LOC101303799 n=1 Tax=Fragaria vesca subsp. vesca TaxID=101020 RepID=UPI0002C2FCDF|nr:PREDICTED: uncharacterized protein LOC101303799 [Fragaria vesca subsp. vesca]
MEGIEAMKVQELIDEESGEWEQWLLKDLFTDAEAQVIGKIPLSLRGGEDRWMWHFDRKGLYSVRSGYHVARKVEHMETIASSSSSQGGWGFIWKKVWKVNVPPKVRMHAWRILKEVLPTKWVLKKKGVDLGVECPFCGGDKEDGLHIFKNCGVVNQLWKCSSLTSTPSTHPAMEIKAWLCDMVELMHVKKLEVFLYTLWAIWVEQNNIVWRGGCFVPVNVAGWVNNQVDEYIKYHCRTDCTTGKQSRRTHTKWRCPPSGRLKINIDGSFVEVQERGGMGVVVRDNNGDCKAAFARPVHYALSALHAEVEALRAGLLITVQQGWDEVGFESDCVALVKAFQKDDEDLSEIGV